MHLSRIINVQAHCIGIQHKLTWRAHTHAHTIHNPTCIQQWIVCDKVSPFPGLFRLVSRYRASWKIQLCSRPMLHTSLVLD